MKKGKVLELMLVYVLSSAVVYLICFLFHLSYFQILLSPCTAATEGFSYLPTFTVFHVLSIAVKIRLVLKYETNVTCVASVSSTLILTIFILTSRKKMRLIVYRFYRFLHFEWSVRKFRSDPWTFSIQP